MHPNSLTDLQIIPHLATKAPQTGGRRDISLQKGSVHPYFAARANLIVTRLQRTEPFCAGATPLFPTAPLLAEARQWLHDVERAFPSIPDRDLLVSLENYDLLHRILRRRPGTPLLRQACLRILGNNAGKSPADIEAYVIDAYFKNQALADNAENNDNADNPDNADNIQSTLHLWETTLSDPLAPLPSLPELTARLRLLIEHPLSSRSKNLTQKAMNLLRNTLSDPSAPAPLLHALLTMTVRLRPILSPHIDTEAAIRRLQSFLSSAPDNHPLDRAARRQQLANTRAFLHAATP